MGAGYGCEVSRLYNKEDEDKVGLMQCEVTSFEFQPPAG